MSGEISRENGKLGGRPKGSMTAIALQKKRVEEAVKMRIYAHAGGLINAQLQLAKGVTHMFRIDPSTKKHSIVTDPEEINRILDEHGGNPGFSGNGYYYLSTQEPNNMALDSLLNRALGKPTDKVDITSGGEPIGSNPILDDLTLKLNAIYKGTSVNGDGKPSDLVGIEASDQERSGSTDRVQTS